MRSSDVELPVNQEGAVESIPAPEGGAQERGGDRKSLVMRVGLRLQGWGRGWGHASSTVATKNIGGIVHVSLGIIWGANYPLITCTQTPEW